MRNCIKGVAALGRLRTTVQRNPHMPDAFLELLAFRSGLHLPWSPGLPSCWYHWSVNYPSQHLGILWHLYSGPNPKSWLFYSVRAFTLRLSAVLPQYSHFSHGYLSTRKIVTASRGHSPRMPLPMGMSTWATTP